MVPVLSEGRLQERLLAHRFAPPPRRTTSKKSGGNSLDGDVVCATLVHLKTCTSCSDACVLRGKVKWKQLQIGARS